jgi:hypothetical protein
MAQMHKAVSAHAEVQVHETCTHPRVSRAPAGCRFWFLHAFSIPTLVQVEVQCAATGELLVFPHGAWLDQQHGLSQELWPDRDGDGTGDMGRSSELVTYRVVVYTSDMRCEHPWGKQRGGDRAIRLVLRMEFGGGRRCLCPIQGC